MRCSSTCAHVNAMLRAAVTSSVSCRYAFVPIRPVIMDRDRIVSCMSSASLCSGSSGVMTMWHSKAFMELVPLEVVTLMRKSVMPDISSSATNWSLSAWSSNTGWFQHDHAGWNAMFRSDFALVVLCLSRPPPVLDICPSPRGRSPLALARGPPCLPPAPPIAGITCSSDQHAHVGSHAHANRSGCARADARDMQCRQGGIANEQIIRNSSSSQIGTCLATSRHVPGALANDRSCFVPLALGLRCFRRSAIVNSTRPSAFMTRRVAQEMPRDTQKLLHSVS